MRDGAGAGERQLGAWRDGGPADRFAVVVGDDAGCDRAGRQLPHVLAPGPAGQGAVRRRGQAVRETPADRRVGVALRAQQGREVVERGGRTDDEGHRRRLVGERLGEHPVSVGLERLVADLEGPGHGADGPESRSEVRAVYGGFGLAIAAVLGLALAVPGLRIGVVLTVAFALGGMAVGRVLSRLVDRPTAFYPIWFYFLVEAVASGLIIGVVGPWRP